MVLLFLRIFMLSIKMKYIFLLLSFLITAIAAVHATHMRAGEITFKYISDLTYEFTITTYVYSPSEADRPELEIKWGDGKSEIVKRAKRVELGNDISYCIYTAQHTFPGVATYTVSLEDPNRNEGVINIPYSVDVPFYIETQILINPAIKENSSPILLNPPIDYACIEAPFIHNPGAFDADGDSLSYKIVPCRGEEGKIIPGYRYPDASSSFSIDSITGDLFWDSPKLQGEYNMAIIIEEWRFGVKISSVIRDLQVNVLVCENDPPEVNAVKDTCVVAGTLIKFNVTATDQNFDSVTVSATGGPFRLKNPAIFSTKTGYKFVQSEFEWTTTCEHIRKNPYQVFFKAMDDGYLISLSDFSTLNISVIAPAPTGFTATPQGNNINLTWDLSTCSNAKGYKIYRRENSYGQTPSLCETGVPAYTGYKKITDIKNVSTTSFTDKNNGEGLMPGVTYCYVIIAYFDDGAESIMSQEVCAKLILNMPIITHVSVNTTSPTNGSILLRWAAPLTINKDSLKGTYKYLIFRSSGQNSNSFVLIDSTMAIADTIYTDTLLNTESETYKYRIVLLHDTLAVVTTEGTSRNASSLHISARTSDNLIQLSWEPQTPWINTSYVIYRKIPGATTFDSIAITDQLSYTDIGLQNNQTYCYFIYSIGAYPATEIMQPLINYSQELCAVPIDNIAPCPPPVRVLSDCKKIVNTISWTLPKYICSNASDVAGYKIYFGTAASDSYSLIAEVKHPLDTVFIHTITGSIAGCYTISVIDSTGNESIRSDEVCVDIDGCNLYRLPDAFTPNGDGVNDLFVPFDYDVVDHISIVIYNRWGSVVFESTDPAINWDSTNKLSGIYCSDGVYFYICDVYEQRLEGIVMRQLKGYIHLIR